MTRSPQDRRPSVASSFRTPGAREFVESHQQAITSPPLPPPAPEVGESAGDDSPRPSSVRLPKDILEQLAAARAATGMTNGDLFIVAIEHSAAKLETLLFPGGRIGGELFAARGVRAKTSRDSDMSQATFRLRPEDFNVIDDLVRRFGARSRGHLLTAALQGFFTDGGVASLGGSE
ncbi:MAG TPA: hypothetical protein VIW24_04145 [Aldersonia sp.]